MKQQLCYEIPEPHRLMPPTTRYIAVEEVSADAIQCYRHHLNDIGMSPASIIERHTRGISTTIVEYVVTGKGLASFLSILFNWAKSEGREATLRQALKVHLLIHPSTRLSRIQLDKDDPIFCTRQTIDANLMESLNRWNDGRIVPFCEPKSWGGL